MAAVKTSAVKSQTGSFLRPEPAESLFPNSAIMAARISSRHNDNAMRLLALHPRSDQHAAGLPSSLSPGPVRKTLTHASVTPDALPVPLSARARAAQNGSASGRYVECTGCGVSAYLCASQDDSIAGTKPTRP